MNCPQCKQEIKTDRSSRQNAYWWVCMTILGNHLGYERNEMSTVVKDHYKWFTEVINKDTGEVLKDYESSASWSKDLFSSRTETLLQFAAEHDVYLQTPEEYFNQCN